MNTTNNRKLEFCFDVGSPATYLAWTQLPILQKETEAEIIYKPVLLGGIFKATGNTSPASNPAKSKYTLIDFKRYVKRYNIEFNYNPYFPINTLSLMRMIVGIQLYHPEQFKEFLNLIFDAIWVKKKNLGDIEIVKQLLDESNFNTQEVLKLNDDLEVKNILQLNTQEAVQKGAFGAPTFFVENEIFFGQDRLEFVREALLNISI